MKKVSKLIWIPVAIVAALAVAIVVLCLVNVNPLMRTFDGYERVALLVSSDGNEFEYVTDEEGNNLTEDALNGGLKDARFSVMQGILEGKFSYKLSLKTRKNGDETEPDTVDAATINSYGAAEGEYVLKFYFDEPRTLELGGTKIIYDRLLLRIYDSKGEIRDMECIPYLDYNVANESTDSEYDENGRIGSLYYNANIIRVKMNTSRLILNIQDLMGD